MTPWVCPWCGCMNYQDERVGRKEPSCVRCRKERKTLEEAKEEINFKKVRLEKRIAQEKETARHHQGMIFTLENSISELQCEMDEHVKALSIAKEELNDDTRTLDELESTVIYEKAERYIARTQTRIEAFV